MGDTRGIVVSLVGYVLLVALAVGVIVAVVTH
jgi:hypothetical protein